MNRYAIALIALVLSVFCSSAALAQAPALPLLQLSASTQAEVQVPRDPSLQLSAPDPELWRAQRRARLLLASGIGMLVGSATHLAWATPRRHCVQDKTRSTSLYGAGITGAVGVALTLGGGFWLADSGTRRYPASTGQKVGAAFLALGTAVATQALLGLVFAVESAGACAN